MDRKNYYSYQPKIGDLVFPIFSLNVLDQDFLFNVEELPKNIALLPYKENISYTYKELLFCTYKNHIRFLYLGEIEKVLFVKKSNNINNNKSFFRLNEDCYFLHKTIKLLKDKEVIYIENKTNLYFEKIA